MQLGLWQLVSGIPNSSLVFLSTVASGWQQIKSLMKASKGTGYPVHVALVQSELLVLSERRTNPRKLSISPTHASEPLKAACLQNPSLEVEL